MQAPVELIAAAETYQPTNEVLEILRRSTVIAIVGPLAVGKTTCIGHIERAVDGFDRIQGFSTRPMRADDEPDLYRFLAHTPETITDITQKMRDGLLAHYSVHPAGNYVYGSEAMDYREPYSLLDAVFSAAAQLRKLPFRELTEISLVCEPLEWVARLHNRGMRGDDLRRRLAEGADSLAWSLEQGNARIWVRNEQDRLDATCQEIVEIARGERAPNPAARTTGEALLRVVRQML